MRTLIIAFLMTLALTMSLKNTKGESAEIKEPTATELSLDELEALIKSDMEKGGQEPTATEVDPLPEEFSNATGTPKVLAESQSSQY